MLHSFVEIDVNRLQRRNFYAFAIYSPGGHLGDMTWTILYTNFNSPFLLKDAPHEV